VHEVLRSPGQPLDTATRAFFEPRFGQDLSQVRVHADEKAAGSAQAVDALAYTVGRNVVFGRGQFSPGTAAGQKLLAHELAHTVQQSSTSLAVVARVPDPAPQQAMAADRREVVEYAAKWLVSMADQVETLRSLAAAAHATTPGSAAAPRAFHKHLNQEVLTRLMGKAISVFEAQRSDNPHINFPTESPEQTQLGDGYARAMEQFGLAMEEARTNAATQTELDISARRHQQVSTQLGNLAATVHQYNLAGDGARRLRLALLDTAYRLVQDSATGSVKAQSDATLAASIQPILDRVAGIEWAVSQAIDRLDRAESRTRAFAANAAANPAVGTTLQTHFSTQDPGYATLLADRLARMKRELRGEGSLAIHARNPQDSDCGVGSVGGGLSFTKAHAKPNHFYFCQSVTIGDEETVSTVVHETVHAVIPSLGAGAPVTSSSATPGDRAYTFERIYSRLSPEEALDNAESYSFYVDELLGVRVERPSAPQDVVTGCTDTGPVHEAIARATYRIRLAAMWASQILDQHRGAALPQYVVTIVQEGFPGADATRAQAVLTHLSLLAGTLDYYLPVACRPATDKEARAGALVYGPGNAAAAGGVTATKSKYPAGTLRVCPAWFTADVAVREDALTAILVFRYRDKVPAVDVMGLVALARHIQEEAHPSVSGRTLQQHQAADAPPKATP
jgi:hypothetical protein